MKQEAIVFLLCVASVLLIILANLWTRHQRALLRHSERLAAMEKGIPIPPEPVTGRPWSPRIYLLRGMIWLFSGIATGIFLLGISLSTLQPESLERRLERAQWMRQRGTPETEVQQFLNAREPREHGLPYGWALIGLIPMGVGLAYIVFYRAEGQKMINGA